MPKSTARIPVYLETGSKKTFACAIDWPGWCRSGRDEAGTLQALFNYAPRYAAAIKLSGIAFKPPPAVSAFNVVERLQGNVTTDYGAPGAIPSADTVNAGDADIKRFASLLKACWDTFDAAASKAQGKELRLGPRGGGRGLVEIIGHVIEAEVAYLSRIGRKLETPLPQDSHAALDITRSEILLGLAASAKGGLPERGPRGGAYWPAPYFVRRTAWHVLDHAWEIEDRIT